MPVGIVQDHERPLFDIAEPILNPADGGLQTAEEGASVGGVGRRIMPIQFPETHDHLAGDHRRVVWIKPEMPIIFGQFSVADSRQVRQLGDARSARQRQQRFGQKIFQSRPDPEDQIGCSLSFQSRWNTS